MTITFFNDIGLNYIVNHAYDSLHQTLSFYMISDQHKLFIHLLYSLTDWNAIENANHSFVLASGGVSDGHSFILGPRLNSALIDDTIDLFMTFIPWNRFSDIMDIDSLKDHLIGHFHYQLLDLSIMI